ncbi:hypothetical protein F4810DRAFT_715778 [Camillea tinctor]|nr:hypothetical protein F4810DRAFT_715778 [Camillea tinctor]
MEAVVEPIVEPPTMEPSSAGLGLKRIFPAENAVVPQDISRYTNHGGCINISIIAIHGLDTKSLRTWIFDKKDGSRAVHWLKDSDMLPAAVPEARIYTHTDNLLGLLAAERGTSKRPIIFIASCFERLVLAEAICRADQGDHKYRRILLFTIGIVFLATPFFGTGAARPASWLVVVNGIMGKGASGQLIKDFEERENLLAKAIFKVDFFQRRAANDEGCRCGADHSCRSLCAYTSRKIVIWVYICCLLLRPLTEYILRLIKDNFLKGRQRSLVLSIALMHFIIYFQNHIFFPFYTQIMHSRSIEVEKVRDVSNRNTEQTLQCSKTSEPNQRAEPVDCAVVDRPAYLPEMKDICEIELLGNREDQSRRQVK